VPILNPKQPSETVLYPLDLTLTLRETSDAISTYTLAVTAGTVTIGEDYNTDNVVFAPISGGADGETATLLLTVTTGLEQVLKRTYNLYISNTAVSVENSTNTKRQIVEMVFEEAGLAGYEYDSTPEEQASVLRRMDAIMGEWASPGTQLDLGYNFPTTFGGSDMDDASGIPDFAVNAVALTVALRAYPAIGKTMSAETRVALGNGMNSIRAYCATIPDRQLTYATSRGAGNKPFSTWAPFVGSGGR
jgi:hypothetical protein